MSGLQVEEVMAWTVDDVLKWIQMNNLGIFRPFISRECINGQGLLQLDKKRLEGANEARKAEKENLLKLLKNIGKDKDKKKGKSIFKGGKGANGSAAVPSSVQPPSIRPPPQPPVDDEEFEEIYDPDEWDDDRGIYDNDTQPEINPRVYPPDNADNESEDDSEYVNPNEEFPNENESHIIQESYYEEDTSAMQVQRTTGGRGAAPPPPPHFHDDEELYEDPDQSVSAPPLPPIPSAPSKTPNQRLPPPIPSDDFYEPADPPPMKAPPVKHSNYEPAAIARMPSGSKSRGTVPPAPARIQQEELPEKAPDRPPPRRRPVPPPCVPVLDDDHDDPAPACPIPPPGKRTVPVPVQVPTQRSVPIPSIPAPLLSHQSPPQEIYEEAEDLQEKILPPNRRGSEGIVRPALPKPPPPPVDDDVYEPTLDGELRDDEEDVPAWSKPAAAQPTAKNPGSNAVNFGVSSIALRDIKGNLKKAIPNFNPESSSTNTASNEVKGKFQEATPRVQARPPDAPKKRQPPAPSKQQGFRGAPGGPDSAEPPRERPPPGAPLPQETEPRSAADPNDVANQPWFFGDFPSNEATVLLKKLNKDGTYLVRESKRSGHLHTLVLFFKGDIFNIPIRKRRDGKFALGSEKADEHVFETVSDMVRFHRNNTIEVSKEGKAVGKVKLAKIAEK